jgi:thioredoxin
MAVLCLCVCLGQPVAEEPESSAIIHLTKADFLAKVADYQSNREWKYLGDKPALIDFYADWCGPCKKMEPILEELAVQYSGQIYIYKIDTDKEKEVVAFFQIQSIPYMLFVPQEGWPQQMVGTAPKDFMEKVIQDVLLKHPDSDSEETLEK